MFLSLLSPNRGQVTGAIIGVMQALFGVGTWFVPLLLGALGIWLALRHVTEAQGLTAWRITGILGLLIAFEGFAHLVAGLPDPSIPGNETIGGGAVGWLFSQGLILALGLPAAIATLLVIAFFSVMAVFGLTVTDVGQKLSALAAAFRREPAGPEGVRVNPPLPLGEPENFLQRWVRRLRERRTPLHQPAPFPPVTSGPATPATWPADRRATPAVRPAPGQKPALPGASTGATATGGTPAAHPAAPALPSRASSAAPARPGTVLGNPRGQHRAGHQAGRPAQAHQIIEHTLAGSGAGAGGRGQPGAGGHVVRPAAGHHHPQDRKGEEKQIKVRARRFRRSPMTCRWRSPPRPSASRRLCRAAISSASKCRT